MSTHNPPPKRPATLISLLNNPTHEGKSGVNSLYTEVLRQAYPEFDPTTRTQMTRKYIAISGLWLEWWYLSARNFYGFKFRLLTKSRFPRSLISFAIETPHLLFPFISLLRTHQKTGRTRWIIDHD